MKIVFCICLVTILSNNIGALDYTENTDEFPTDYVIIFDASISMKEIIKGGEYNGKTRLEVAQTEPFNLFFRDRTIKDIDSIILILVGREDLDHIIIEGEGGSEKKNQLQKELLNITEAELGYPSNLSQALRSAVEIFDNAPDNFHWLVIISDGEQSPVEDDICITAKEIKARYGSDLKIDSWIWFGITMNEENALKLACVSAYLPFGVITDISDPINLKHEKSIEIAHKEIYKLNKKIEILKDEIDRIENEKLDLLSRKNSEIENVKNQLENCNDQLTHKSDLYQEIKPILYILLIGLCIGFILIFLSIKTFFK